MVLRRIIKHLLTVAFETLKADNTLFRIFFNKFPETEYTTLTIDRIYDKLNEHLQSNDQISVEGVWNGYMVVSRFAIDKRKKKAPFQNNHPRDLLKNDILLEGQGKQENYLTNLGLVNVEVNQNCLAHAVLLNMSMHDRGELYRAFLAGFDRYLKVIVEENLCEVENSCELLSRLNDAKKLHRNYLNEKNFDLCVYGKREENFVQI